MTKSLRLFLLLFMFTALACGDVFAQSFKSEAELRKNAEKDFKNEDYAAALPLYSQLLSLYQRDPKLNYRYGVCLLMADKDKSSAYNYLEFASHSTSTETDVFFYMAKALQLNFRFDEAIASYEEFAKRARRKMDTDRQIETCKNAKELLKNRLNAVVKHSKEVSKNALYGAYDGFAGSGKLLTASEMFLSPADKHNTTSPMMYLNTDGQTIYYSSYGRNEDNGKDIYIIHKLPSGGWGIPENLGTVVNTKYDEDYPYMDADGKTLYFSSKGHNSMGGYDLFKTTYNAYENTWSEPVNLGAGINSPDDDFFYMPINDGEAQFASAKETPFGTLTIYTIEVEKNQKTLVAVHGKFRSLDHPERADARVSVLRKSDNGLVATARTDQRTGEYELAVPAGDDYQIVVQGGGYMAHAEDFTLPASKGTVTITQQVDMNRSKGNEQIEIRNKYIQSDSTAVASAEFPKEQVIKDEYAADQVSHMNLKQFTVDGQVIYATAPSSKDARVVNQISKPTGESVTEKAQAIRDAVAIADKAQEKKESVKTEKADTIASPAIARHDDTILTDKTEIKKEGTSTVVTETTSISKADANTNADVNEVANQSTTSVSEQAGSSPQTDSAAVESLFDSLATDEKTADMQDTKINVESGPSKSTEYASNISDKELVKIAYNDAKEIDQEAKALAAEAAAAHASANVKDSVSKAKLDEMLKVLKTGDEAAARELSRESQVSADSAQQVRTHAADLDEQAKAKQEAADKALADAGELEKNTMKQAAEKTAMNKAKKNAKGDKNKESTKTDKQAAVVSAAQPVTVAMSDSGKTSSQFTAVNDVKIPDAVKEKEAAKQNASGAALVTDVPKQTDETKVNAAASNDEKAADLSSQTSTSNSNPSADKNALTTEAAVDKSKSQQQLVVNPVSSEEPTKNTETEKTTNETADKQISKEKSTSPGKDVQPVTEQTKTSDKQEAVITETTKNETVAAPKPEAAKTAVMNEQAAAKEQPAVQQATITKASKTETAVVSNPSSSNVEDKKPSQSSAAAAEVKDTPASGTKEVVNNPVALNENKAKDNKTPEASLSETTGKAKQTDLSTPVTEEKSAELLKDIPAETVNAYKEYVQTKSESDKEARQANAMQEKIAKMPPSPERDQLAAKANELNVQSIKTWQQAQAKLNSIKESNPEAAAKLSEAFSQPAVAQEETVSIVEPKKTTQPTDPLLSQAVTHREAAEKANDKPTETAELQKTKDLIIQSRDTKQAVAESNSAAKEKATVTDSPPSADKKNETMVASTAPVESSSKVEGVKEPVPSKETPANDAKAVPSKVNAVEANASASSLTPDNTTPVLSAKTLNVDEGAIFTVSPTQPYNASNPIPMDPQLPEGLVFKVQIGAFHSPLPVEAFKNVQPLSGETTRPGWIRYCVGLFRTFEPANVVKMNMRSTGYKDAFVVAYYNGKRINLFDAYAIINRSGTREKELYAVATEKESHHLSSMNMKASDYAMNNDVDAASFYGTSATTPKIDESLIEYAVQVGVYRTNLVPKKLQSLIPLNVDSYRNNLYRFTTGRFIARTQADSLRLIAVNTGVKDAFVVIYKGGNRTGENYSSNTGNKTNAAVNSPSSSAEAPASGFIYRIQIGAYKSAFSDDQIATLKSRFKTDITQSSNTTGYHLLYAGSFSDYTAAVLYKKFLAANGANDAFVVAFSGGNKIPVQKALQQAGK